MSDASTKAVGVDLAGVLAQDDKIHILEGEDPNS